MAAFNGRFARSGFDESAYAAEVATAADIDLFQVDITESDFVDRIEDVIYHLDYPVAGPGSFPQFVVSELAADHRKVVLGGQGGDEIFGGYVRYLIAYFEQCIKGAIEGTMHSGNFVVTYESIIPNLGTLREYKPLLKDFWRQGLFDELDARYFRLINRASDLEDEIDWELLGPYSPFETFRSVFNGDNVGKEAYFDSMTHFDFKTLLPALLHVEDRVSMAHGLESRVPFLDHPLVELAATMPANVKFTDGNLKHVFKSAFGARLPDSVRSRRDKMGFPVPLHDWLRSSGPAESSSSTFSLRRTHAAARSSTTVVSWTRSTASRCSAASSGDCSASSSGSASTTIERPRSANARMESSREDPDYGRRRVHWFAPRRPASRERRRRTGDRQLCDRQARQSRRARAPRDRGRHDRRR